VCCELDHGRAPRELLEPPTKIQASARGRAAIRGSSGALSAAYIALVLAVVLFAPTASRAHPMGNFSISHYAGIKIEPHQVELRYLIDMAEIPTFQELQDNGIAAEAGHPSLRPYLAKKAELLKHGLILQIDGQPLRLQTLEPRQIIFPLGAGGLPTLKLRLLYRARLPAGAASRQLHFEDRNFPDRAGWKEVVVQAASGITVTSQSVPQKDRSAELTNYPTDMLSSPPQDVEADIAFAGGLTPDTAGANAHSALARVPSVNRKPGDANPAPTQRSLRESMEADASWSSDAPAPAMQPKPPATLAQTMRVDERPALQPNIQPTPRSSFTKLMTAKEWGIGVLSLAIAIAVGLGALHALEPGHGKTIVAAYLVGSRGTARHAILLGLIVTATHTAGVYLLGAVTLYASRYVVPERLYPWLGLASGLIIAWMGLYLLGQRFTASVHRYAMRYSLAGTDLGLTHIHPAHTGHHHSEAGHHHHHFGAHHHHHGGASHHHGAISMRQLLALGVSGGIIPCPAAVVVLLSALSVHRIGLGFLLIVAFSIGLAAVLIAIGLLVLYARNLIARFKGDGPLFSQWLPLASATVITIFGLAITVNAWHAAALPR
jgi:nickel/cobalt exporter